MAQLNGEYTPNFAATLVRMQNEGNVETATLIIGLVAAVRAAARLGRHCAELAYHRFVKATGVNTSQEEIFEQVDWQAVQQQFPAQDSQQCSPGTTSTGSSGAGSFGRFVETKRAAAGSSTTTTTTTQTGKVDAQVQRVEAGKPMKPVNSSDDNDDHNQSSCNWFSPLPTPFPGDRYW